MLVLIVLMLLLLGPKKLDPSALTMHPKIFLALSSHVPLSLSLFVICNLIQHDPKEGSGTVIVTILI